MSRQSLFERKQKRRTSKPIDVKNHFSALRAYLANPEKNRLVHRYCLYYHCSRLVSVINLYPGNKKDQDESNLAHNIFMHDHYHNAPDTASIEAFATHLIQGKKLLPGYIQSYPHTPSLDELRQRLITLYEALSEIRDDRENPNTLTACMWILTMIGEVLQQLFHQYNVDTHTGSYFLFESLLDIVTHKPELIDLSNILEYTDYEPFITHHTLQYDNDKHFILHIRCDGSSERIHRKQVCELLEISSYEAYFAPLLEKINLIVDTDSSASSVQGDEGESSIAETVMAYSSCSS